jgi:hypothetical protein
MVLRPNVDPTLCFVLTPFHEPFTTYYERIIVPAARDAGLRALWGREIFGVNPVMNDIWQSIWRARVAVAELTGRNPNVNYELGLCHALGVPVVLITQSMADVPFDYRQLRVIPYNTADVDWAEQLRRKIAGTLETISTMPETSVGLEWPRGARLSSLAPPLSYEQLTEVIADLCAAFEKESYGWPLHPTDAPTENQRAAIHDFLEKLGLLEQRDRRLRPVSPLAYAFLASLAAHFRNRSSSYFGNWRRDDRLREMVAAWEHFRLSQRRDATPSRLIRVATVLIHGVVNAVDCALMLKARFEETEGGSDLWKFVGGTEQPDDGHDLQATLLRELHEEALIKPESIQFGNVRNFLIPLSPAESDRLGVQTGYEVHLFPVLLAEPDLARFRRRGPIVVRAHSRDEVLDWIPWVDVLQGVRLAGQLKPLVEGLATIPFTEVPVSVSL